MDIHKKRYRGERIETKISPTYATPNPGFYYFVLQLASFFKYYFFPKTSHNFLLDNNSKAFLVCEFNMSYFLTYEVSFGQNKQSGLLLNGLFLNLACDFCNILLSTTQTDQHMIRRKLPYNFLQTVNRNIPEGERKVNCVMSRTQRARGMRATHHRLTNSTPDWPTRHLTDQPDP